MNYWNKFYKIHFVVADHKILNVFELLMVEVIQELFKQIRKESSLELSLTFTTGKSINTRRTMKGLLDVPYSRTIVKRKSLSNTASPHWLRTLSQNYPRVVSLIAFQHVSKDAGTALTQC